MDDFIFDLQRFDDATATVLGEDDTIKLTFGSGSDAVEKIIKGGSSNVKVTVNSENNVTTSAVISLSSADQKFFAIDNNGTWNYKLDSIGSDGVIITIDSSSVATVGALDAKDVFLVKSTVGTESVTSDITLSKSTTGILVNDNGFIESDSVSSVILSGTALSSPTTDFYKVAKITKENDSATITLAADSFSTEGYTKNSAYAMDPASHSIYARLRPSSNTDIYRIQSVAGGAENNTLSSITIADEAVLSVGVSFTENFAGASGGTPTIIAGSDNKATLHVDKANGVFTVSSFNNNDKKYISLSSNAEEISLIAGSLITANNAQSIKTSKYTVSGYTDSKNNNDGIIIYGDTSNATLEDVDVGESFVIAASNSTATTYTMTNLGLVRGNDTLPLSLTGGDRITSNTLSISEIATASPMSDYTNTFLNAKDVITLSGSSGESLIAYFDSENKTSALVTVKPVSGSTDVYSLGTGNSYADLNLGKWGGISLSTTQSLVFGASAFASSESEPLKIMTKNATFGVAEASLKSGNSDVTISGSISTIPYSGSQKFNKVRLINGTLNLGNNNQDALGQVVSLYGGKDIDFIYGDSGFRTLSSDQNGATVIAAGGTNTVGRGAINGATTVIVDSMGSARTTATVTVDPSNTKTAIFNPKFSGNGVTIIYGKTSGISVTGLTNKDAFRSTIKAGNVVKTYQVVPNADDTNAPPVFLSYNSVSVSGGVRIFNSTNGTVETESGVYDLNDDNFSENIPASDGSITIESDLNFKNDETRSILSVTLAKNGTVSAVSGNYGTLAKTVVSNSSFYELAVNNNKSLSAVTITDAVPVHFKSGDFTNTSINVANTLSTFSFLNLDDNISDNFYVTVGGDEEYFNVSGASTISLLSGTIIADSESPTIKVSDSVSGSVTSYVVGSDSASTVKDGIEVGISVSGSGNKQTVNAIIGDIDLGESFNVGGKTYTRNASPLNITTSDGYSYLVDAVSGDMSNSDDEVAIKIRDLVNPESKRKLIAAESVSSTDYGNNKYVLALNKDVKESAMIVNQSVNASSVYADLTVTTVTGSKEYYLDTIDNASSNWNADIISISGGTASINSSVVEDRLIVAAGSKAAFKVSNTSSSGIFIVDGKSTSVQSIGGATELTLVNGSIVAVPTIYNKTTYQVITLGESERTFQAANNITLAYGMASSLGTIDGSAGNRFSLDSETYSVGGGDGVKFIVGKDNVTVSNFAYDKNNTTNSDFFYYNGDAYSMRAAGLVKHETQSGGKDYLWNDSNGNHTLTKNSIAVSDLAPEGNWLNIMSIGADTATVRSDVTSTVILIDSLYSGTYGQLSGSGNSYSLTKTNADTLTLSAVNLTTLSSATLSLDSDFKDITIKSGAATVIPTALVSGAENYQFIRYSKSASLSGVTEASLLNGTLTADSLLTVTVSNGSNDTDIATVKELGSSIVTLTTTGKSASIATSIGSSFNLDSTTYTLSSVGLSKGNDSLILPGDKNTLAISSINEDANWFKMLEVAQNTLTISSADSYDRDKILVVNSISSPTVKYASLSSASGGLYLKTVSGSKNWSSDDTIFIDTTDKVTIANDTAFKNRTIVGKESNAVFSVTSSSSDFVVIDSEDGASVSNATGINLTGGTITTKSANQTIAVGDYSVKYGSGDGINVAYSGTSASLGALNKGDVFTVSGASNFKAEYSLSSDSRIRKDSNKKMWSQTVNGGNALISSLVADENWKGIVTAKSGSITIDSNALKNNFTNNEAYIVDSVNSSSDDDIIYGTLVSLDGSYSMGTAGSNANSLNNIKIAIDGPITIASAFANETTFNTGDKATISVSSSNDFVISKSGNYYAVTDSNELTLSSGTIKSTSINQTVHADEYEIYAISLGSDSAINVMNNSGKVSIGALDTGEIFGDGSDTYKVTGVGIINSDNKIGDDAGWDSAGKLFSVGTVFETGILTLDANGELDFSNPEEINYIVVDDATALTNRLGKMSYTSDGGAAFSLTASTVTGYTDSIKSIALGTNTIPLNTSRNAIVKTSQGTETYKINSDSYVAANSALSIQSGAAANKSSLLSGAVALDTTDSSSVKITDNTISATAGDGITVTADGASATISSLNDGDVFSVGKSEYSLTGAGLLTRSKSEMKIWKSAKTPESVVIGSTGLDDDSSWQNVINISASALIVPTNASQSEYIILSEDYATKYGTVSGSRDSGYTLAVDSWDSNNAVKINRSGMSVAFPAEKFENVTIEGAYSNAKFSVTDSKAFSVVDGKNGASITGTEKISQTDGTIALTNQKQTVTTISDKTTVSHDVNYLETDEGNGITIVINEGAASIGALNTENNQDSFVVDDVDYQMLSNGSIWKSGSKFWLGKIDDGEGVGISDLLTESNWADAVKIADNILMLNSTTINGLSLGFVVDEDDYTKIYGKFTATGSSYTLDGSNITATLSSIVLDESAQVSLTALQDRYLDIPITAGNTEFTAINATSGFTVDYTKAGLGTAASLSTDAPAVSLISGAWTSSDKNQSLTAGGHVIKIGDNTDVTTSITSDGINVTGLNAKDEVVTINADTYKLNSDDGGGISISLTSDSIATIHDISNGDNFKINNDTFIKKSAGFIKTDDANTDNFLWINALDVTDGVLAESLTGEDVNTDNWAKAETISGGAVSITSSSSDAAIFIDNVDDLKSVYGVLTKNATKNFTLHNKKSAASANTKPSSITIENVSASLTPYYTDIPIYAAGASFVVTALIPTDSLTSTDSLTPADSFFYVDATGTNAVLGSVSSVSLGSGTLANLTKATTVETSYEKVSHEITAKDNSLINVGLSGAEITFSELDDGEGLTFDGNAYVYKDVGIVKDNQSLYVNNTLGHSITAESLTGATYLSMFANGGTSTLTLQNKLSGVFVDNAGDSVSEVYAFQTYDDINKLYSFTPHLQNINNFVINAASLASGAGISAAFKGQVITPTTGTFTINDKPYTAVTELTVDITTDSSTLNKGTAALAASASIAMTNGDSIAVTGGNGIQVTASPTSYTLGSLDKDDVFVIGGYSYSMLSDNYLFRTKDGTTQLCTTSVTGGALSSSIIFDNGNWDNYVPLERDYTLNLASSSIKTGTVISYDFSKIYADLTANGNKFTLGGISGANTSEISKVSLGADSSTLTVDFAATVRTTSGTGTYNVNGNPYTAKDSELVINASADNSSIMSGVIKLNNSPDITTGSNHTVSGTANELDVAKMSFTPVIGNSFTVDGTAYKMNSVGLTKNDSYIWTRSNIETFTLPAADSLWSSMMTLNKDGTLNLKNGVSASSVVVLDNAVTKRMALLNYASSDNAYSLTSEGGNAIETIQLGDSTDSVLSLTANFDSSITTGNGLYKINGNNYRGNGFTVTTADNDSALHSGTVSLSAGTAYNEISDATNSYEVTGGDGITATASNATITTLGNLNSGDTFIIDSKYYKVLGNQTLVQTDSDGGNPSKIYKDLIAGGALNVSNIIDRNFVDYIVMGADGVIDLSSALGTDGWSAVVLAEDDSGDPTLRIAKVSYTDDGGYKLETTSDGDPTSITAVKLGAAVKTFSTAIDTTVNISAVGTYSINGQPFTAQNDLKIAASNGDEATLINGAVTLGEDTTVTTRRTNGGTPTDETIKTTSGSITVTVNEAAGTVTLSGLNPGEKFTFGSNEYTMTPIGLQNGSKLNPTVAATASVPTTDLDLTGSNWLTLLQATGGALTLTSSTPSNVVVVDMTSSTQAVKYGTLTKSGDIYTLTQDDTDTKLASIALNGVRATLGAKASDVDITTNGTTTFSVTATDNFTINAASGGNPIVSDLTNVSGIYLSAGTIVAPTNIPVTANGYAVKATNGDMNISIVDGATQISGLEKDDTFTVDDTTNYKMVDIGLLDVTNQQLRTAVEDTYTIGEEFTRIIAVDADTTNLNLSNETKNADVYDSISAPRTQLGTLTVSKGVKTLAAVGSGATMMQSVDVAAKDNLVVTFETRVNSPIGTVTVNNKTYAGTTALAIDSDGTTSTLYSGTITLDITNPSATDSDKNTLTREVGTFTATAAGGKFTTLTNLDNAESFSYGGATYTQNIPGLIDTTGNVICTDILAGATITLADLKDATWNNFTAPVDSVLNISALNSNYIIYDSATTPTTKYATFTLADGKKTLTGETVAAANISEVVIAAGDDLTVDFVTQVDAPIGSVTVNDKTYAGTTELLIDSDGTTSTLYDGTITLDGTNTTATDSDSNTLTRAGGSFTATAVEGTFTEINGLDNTESFTYGGATYVQSAQGLRNGALIRRDLTGTTIDLSKLSGTWDNILAPVDGVLDISTFSGNAYVYNSATNPTVQLATLTTADGVKTLTNTNNAAGSISAVQIAAGDKLAVDFATDINAPIGSVTVNGKDYVGTTALVITSDGTTSTLTDGTITLADNGNTVTTTGGTTVTYTTDGDGMTVVADNSGESEIVTFSGLTTGDTFTIGDAAYKVSAVAPINPAGELWTGGDYSAGITLAQINDATNWTPMLAAPNAALSINAETLTDGGKLIVVDNVDDPTKIYGDLTKTDGAYTLTRPTTANDNLTSLKVSGAAIELAPDYAGVNFTANNSAFSDVTLNDAGTTFTLDATNTPSLSDNVSALTLTAGTIEAAVNQVVTTGGNVINPTAINGEMIIGTATISGIVEGDTFTLNDKAYAMLNTGLFNDTDNKLVTSGIDDGTLTIADIAETQLLAISNGELNLGNAAAGNSLIVDTIESPANIYGLLNKNENTYTLDKRSDGITSITLPNATATLTTDIAATVNAPSSSNTYTVNGKIYKANDSALTIASDGTTSTLTDGTITLADNGNTVTTTGGSTITYTADGDGMTLAVNGGITFSGLTTGDTFTIGDAAYKVSAVAPINPAGELWTGGDYSAGITLAQINDAANWTPMLAAPDAALSINAETLADGGELIVVDNVDNPTKIYGDLIKAEGTYTLTRPTTANDDLTSINVSGATIELAPNYAGVNFTANDSAFSDVTLNDAETSFTLDATNTPSLSDNVRALTLTAGTIEAAVNQVVTTGDNVITPTAINGEMVIGTATISGIVEGDTFTLNDKAYAMLNTGLFNDTDNKLVTSGIDDGTLTIADIIETQLFAISNGELNLGNAAAGNSLIVDKVESPANIYGLLNKNENTYTLDKRADGITTITLPDATSTLTTDIAATVNAPSSSNTYTVNGKIYKANDSALTIASDGTTSTLTNGTINLTNNNDTVTTTSGSTVTYTTDGDGMTLAVTSSGITFSGLTTGDTFTIGDNAYRVSELGFHNDANYLWTSDTDYKGGVTLAQIDDAANWTPTVIASNDTLSVNRNTLTDGATAIIIDSATAATKSLGTLSRTGDTYTVTRDATNKLSAINVANTKVAIDNQLADVPVTAKGATFTVTANVPYTVDATGNTVSISDDATAIEISAGTIAATTNQTVTATATSGATSVIGQNNGTFKVGGENFTVADNVGSITFGMTNGVPDKVSGFEENANVTIDGRTYTAPKDDSTLLFSDADGWYFDGYVPTKYNITVDGDGNVIVDAGVKFTDVIASGQTLPEDSTIKLAVDVNNIPISVTNAGTTAININDINDNPLAANLGTVENVTFDSAGVMVENTSDVAGAVFTIDTGQSLETETATVTANADDCAVGVGANGNSLSVDKAASVDAPADTALTLGNARYTVNGVYFTSGGTAQASLTSDGVKFDLVASDVITYNRTNFDGTGTATAEIDKDSGISLTSGASIDGATGKTFNIAGTVTLDANTIDAASATDVKVKTSGYAVGNDDVTVTGDEDGYKVDISDGKISGLEYIGGESGITIAGLSSGTIKTDKVGAFTVADKTFIAVGDASVTYGIENGTLTSASDVDSVITGDFSDGLTVNNGKLQVTGDDVSLDVSKDSDRKVDGFNDKATLTTADNVVKIEPTGAGEFTFGDHVFKVDDATIAFNLKNSSVIGIDSLENGNLIISQDEYGFIVNDESIDLAEIDSPVTLEIADSGIHSVYGLHSGMDGLDVATVYGVSAATINNKYFEITGGTLDAVVVDSVATSLYGLESDMTINSAPSVAIRTTENGTFTFGNDIFNINDTVDGVVVFETDANSHVINIDEFAGEIYGDLKNTALNDKAFSTSSDKVTVISDGEDIIKLQGLSSGDSISGSLSTAVYVMPEGTLNVNDRGYILQGDDDGVSMQGDGLLVTGLDTDASLTVVKGGSYSINDQNFKAKDGDTFIAGRDGIYIADPNNKPITEKTKIDDIIENLLGKQKEGTVSLSGDKAASVIASGKLDGSMALTLDSNLNADFSNSTDSKRVTLLGGNQDVKFNDEGGNSAYVDKTASGRKRIELGDGGDVAVNDSPYARVSIKAGKGADTIVNRNGARSTVDVKNNGDTTIVPTSGKVTLQNYDNDNNAKIRTFEYRNLPDAIINNEVKFGDGVMTLGDAVVVFDPDAEKEGGTFANLVDYSGEEQRVGFTHSNGGVLNASTSGDNLILKGNYAQSSSDRTKNGASTLISGRGNDTILAGGDDYVDAGAGENQIYITDKNLAGGGDGVTIVLGDKGKNTVHNFNGGFDDGDAVKVNDVSKVNFIFGEDGLVMRSGRSLISFDGLEPADDLITYDDAETAAPYEIKLSDGKKEYYAAVAQEGSDIGVREDSEANLFYGEKNGKTGVNFSEYAGAIEVNLNTGLGSLNGSAAQFYNISKVTAGAGDSSLIGKAGARNTLTAGTGNTSMWSAAGRDLMVGNTSEEKDGSTMFYYLPGDGRDTITNFGFMTSANDYNADIINITQANDVGNVYLRGDNAVIQLNNSPDDYLTVVDAKGKHMKFNEVIAKVDVNANFDELATCYVATNKNATMSLGAGIDNAQIWLDDRRTGQHGIYYLGEFKYLDAKEATGNSTLVGNDLDNVIYGGAGKNSIWGGFGNNDDTLVGGTGQNTFFFGMENGNDTITSIQAGDVIDLTTIGLDQIAATTVNSGGAKIQLTDGSSLEIQGNAQVEYRLKDGVTYTADHNSGQFIKR